MMHRPGLRSRFDEAVDLAREIAATLGPGDPVSVALLGSRPRVLLRNVGYDPDRVDRALSGLSPLEEPLNLDAAAAEMTALAAEMEAIQREIYLISDGQAADWQRLSGAARETLAALGEMARCFLVTVPVAGSENAAVTQLELASGVLQKGGIARFAATVRNFGEAPVTDARVVCRVNGVPVDEKTAGFLRGGEAGMVSLFVPITQTGSLRIEACSGHDGLVLDNVRRAVVHIRDAVSVLCVDGDPASEPFQGAAAFVDAALAAGGPAGAGGSLAVKTIPWLALPTERFAEYSVVVLANVAEIPEDQARLLHDFVQDGGGLIVFAGRNVQPVLMNGRMTVGQTPLLPAELLGVAESGTLSGEGIPLDPSLPDHPVVRPLRSLPPDLLEEIRFRQFLKVRVHPRSKVLLQLAGTEDPILLEKQVGRGRVLLFTSSADRRWHTMATNPAYPILLQQAVTYLTSQPELPSTVGAPVAAVLPGARAGVAVTFEDPEGRACAVTAEERNRQVLAVLPDAPKAGFYGVRSGSAAPAISLAVNPDTAESDVRPVPGPELEEAARELHFRLVPEKAGLAAVVREARVGREYWRLLMLAALGVMALESFLARRFSAAMRSRP
jgi:hypothetical protein